MSDATDDQDHQPPLRRSTFTPPDGADATPIDEAPPGDAIAALRDRLRARSREQQWSLSQGFTTPITVIPDPATPRVGAVDVQALAADDRSDVADAAPALDATPAESWAAPDPDHVAESSIAEAPTEPSASESSVAPPVFDPAAFAPPGAEVPAVESPAPEPTVADAPLFLAPLDSASTNLEPTDMRPATEAPESDASAALSDQLPDWPMPTGTSAPADEPASDPPLADALPPEASLADALPDWSVADALTAEPPVADALPAWSAPTIDPVASDAPGDEAEPRPELPPLPSGFVLPPLSDDPVTSYPELVDYVAPVAGDSWRPPADAAPAPAVADVESPSAGAIPGADAAWAPPAPATSWPLTGPVPIADVTAFGAPSPDTRDETDAAPSILAAPAADDAASTWDVDPTIDESAPVEAAPTELEPATAELADLDAPTRAEYPWESPLPASDAEPVAVDAPPAAAGALPWRSADEPPALVEPAPPAAVVPDAAYLATAGIVPEPAAANPDVWLPEDVVGEVAVDGALAAPTSADALPEWPEHFSGQPDAIADENEDEVAAPSEVPIPESPEPEPVAAVESERRTPGMFSFEAAGAEPTPLEQRTGRASRLFWLWFAVGASVVSIAVGAGPIAAGLSLRQGLIVALAGCAVSVLPLALTTLAGKWSGQPTLVVTRAVFGVHGNFLPALAGVVSRMLWAAILIWLVGATATSALTAAGLDGGATPTQLMLAIITGAVVIAGVVGYVGFHLLLKVQFVLAGLTAIGTVGLIAATWSQVDVTAALGANDGDWLLVVGGAAAVFAVVGVTVGHAGADVARYQQPSSSGGAGMVWANLGAVLPALLLVGYGSLLGASDPALAAALSTDPAGALVGILPAGFSIPLLVVIAANLLAGAITALYSSGFAVIAVGLRARRSFATLVVTLLVVGLLAGAFLTGFDVGGNIVAIALVIAVPMAPWTGIVVGDLMTRSRRFDAAGLLAVGGAYPPVRWPHLVAWAVLTAAGFGFLESPVPGFAWTGFLVDVLPASGAVTSLASSGAVVLATLVIATIWPFAVGIPAVRRQEGRQRRTAGAELSA